MTPEAIVARAERALDRRRPWEGVWRDCYDHVLAATPGTGGPALHDGTAADAAETLAASLLAELTPPWSRWFGLAPVSADADPALAAVLERAAEVLQGHLDRSNFALEMHQAFLDLVVAGTGVVLVEEAPAGEPSALRFTAVPLREAVLEEGASGRLDTVFRLVRMGGAAIAARYPGAALPAGLLRAEDPDATHRVIEAVWPDRGGPRFAAVLERDGRGLPLAEGRFEEGPFLAFRWMKAPGETYGRGPVMKALPDIRTAKAV